MVRAAKKTKGSIMKFRSLLSALLLAASLVCVAGCGKKEDAAKAGAKAEKAKDDPAAVFKDWQTALAKGDYAKVRELSVAEPGKKDIWDEEIARFKSVPPATIDEAFGKLEVVKCKVEPMSDSKYPTVSAVAELELKGGRISDVYMVKIDGQWKVCDIK